MPEEVLFSHEAIQSRSEIAVYLRQVAENLDAGEPITLQAGGDSVTLSPPEQPTFEIKVEREGPADQPGELSIEFELEWDADAGDSSGLSIE
ncbi:MAG: amphi-Trp domain-containing protein [Halobacteriales archaeon]|nr:amphi-Trp domain-containing protein [Halobacteriales archaeon]